MIQFKRGTTDSWKKLKKPLAAGQPGYDKDRKKLKIGDGEASWEELPDASGLRMEEILLSEADAKKQKAGILKPLDLLRKMLKTAGRPIFTYGEETPNKDTIGQVYLQCYDAEPEVDYVVESGVDGIWTYSIYKSGNVHCWGILRLATPVQSAVGNGSFFINNITMNNIKYPVTFNAPPIEVVTLNTATNKIAWLASKEACSASATGIYTIISYDKHDNATFEIVFDIKGKIKK